MEKLRERLKELEVGKIYSIDDQWRTSSSLEGNIQSLVDKYSIETDLEIDGLEYTVGEIITLLENEEIFSVEDIDRSNENFDKFYNLLLSEIPDDVDETLQTLLNILENIKEHEHIEYELHNELNDNIVSEMDHSIGTLVILDADYKNQEGVHEDRLIEYMLKLQQLENVLFITYSSKVNEEMNSISKKNEIIKTYFTHHKQSSQNEIMNGLFLVYNLWYIRKSGDVDDLTDRLALSLEKSKYGDVIENIVKHRIQIQHKSYNDLLSLDIDKLELTFIESLIEGDTVVEQIDRIIESSYKKYLANHHEASSEKWLLKYEKNKINEILSGLDFHHEYLQKKETGTLSNTKLGKISKEYRNYRTDHNIRKIGAVGNNNSVYSRANYNINKKLYDTDFGDFYVFSKGTDYEAYMLISQKCDNVIRIQNHYFEDISRKNKYYQFLRLKLTKIDIDDEESIKKNCESLVSKSVWPVKIDDDYFMVQDDDKIEEFQTDIIDLCSLNQEGRASIHLESSELDLDHKSYTSKTYFTKKYDGIKESIEARIKTIEELIFGSRKVNKSELYQRLMLQEFGIEYSKAIKAFKVRRHFRVNDESAHFLLSGYFDNINRVALSPSALNE